MNSCRLSVVGSATRCSAVRRSSAGAVVLVFWLCSPRGRRASLRVLAAPLVRGIVLLFRGLLTPCLAQPLVLGLPSFRKYSERSFYMQPGGTPKVADFGE